MTGEPLENKLFQRAVFGWEDVINSSLPYITLITSFKWQ